MVKVPGWRARIAKGSGEESRSGASSDEMVCSAGGREVVGGGCTRTRRGSWWEVVGSVGERWWWLWECVLRCAWSWWVGEAREEGSDTACCVLAPQPWTGSRGKEAVHGSGGMLPESRAGAANAVVLVPVQAQVYLKGLVAPMCKCVGSQSLDALYWMMHCTGRLGKCTSMQQAGGCGPRGTVQTRTMS